jgi:hypothetical protein
VRGQLLFFKLRATDEDPRPRWRSEALTEGSQGMLHPEGGDLVLMLRNLGGAQANDAGWPKGSM